MNFQLFSDFIASNVDVMTGRADWTLLEADIDPEELWVMYLDSFPAGTNEIYRERREHDCSCCRQFIKGMGNVFAVTPNLDVVTIWDGVTVEYYPYDIVAKGLRDLVLAAPIKGIFAPSQSRYGAAHTFEQLEDGDARRWDHFHCDIPRQRISSAPDEARGKEATTVAVVKRSFEEITPTAVETVLEMIADNQLYRGAENLSKLRRFRDALHLYKDFPIGDHRRDLFLWDHHNDSGLAIRNSSIGTLLVDLSNGVDQDAAVRSYEAKVSPVNYRRSSAPISRSGVTKALETLKSLGLDSAIPRRLATAQDLSVNDVIFVNRSTRGVLRDTLSDLLMPEITPPQVQCQGYQKTPMKDFLANIAPSATKLEILFPTDKTGNLVTLTAPQDDASPPLFAWKGNKIGWAYKGNLTDSIKERVKRAGGDVNGLARVSAEWFNTDDLDLHMTAPGRYHVYHGDKQPYGAYAELDVDMNVGPTTRTPVENITLSKLLDGTYKAWMHQFTYRNASNIGFAVEFAHGGQSVMLSYPKVLRQGEKVDVLTFDVAGGEIVSVTPSPPMIVGSADREVWGLKTGQFHEVRMLVKSPNYWESGNGAGNLHWLFLLDGCVADEPMRGFFNEYLHPELHKHRKVFEVLADKTKCEPTATQLSGLGFSSTIHATFTVRVDGGRTYEVTT